MTSSGIATVARQEFRLRIRAGRWRTLLAAWFLLLAAFTGLLRLAAGTVDGLRDRGTLVYGGLVLVVLGLSLLVVPSLAAQSVNGDRERGTLATLQVTRLSPAEIVLGKFAAAWGTALLFLALTLPLALYAVTQGGVPLGRVLVVTLVIGVLLGTVCALSLWLSAVLSRTTASGLLAYAAVAVLTIGTVIAFGLGTALTAERYPVTYTGLLCSEGAEPGPDYRGPDYRGPDYRGPDYRGPGSPPPAGCVEQPQTYESSRSRTDRTWWLLAPNPFVILADSAPALPDASAPDLTEEEARRRLQARELDPLGQIGGATRDLRRVPMPLERQIAMESGTSGFETEELVEQATTGRPTQRVWPYGLAFNGALAALALALSVRRLRTPSRGLPRGQRVA